MKKVWILMLAVVLCFALAGCGDEKQTLTNEKGEMLALEIDELTENGVFVHDKKNDTFTSVMNASEGYQGVATEFDPYRHLWFGKKEYDFESLIPKVDGDRYELVVIEKNEEDMPETYMLERYKKLGYTLGVKFTFAGTGNDMFMSVGETCASSMASDKITGSSNTYLPVYAINGEKKLPVDNIDTDIEVLLGLEDGKKYDIEYFDGTQLKEETLLADTVVFKSKQLLELASPLKTTTKGYFIIKLPLNLKPGYYYINDNGMFRYAPSDKILKELKDQDNKEKKADSSKSNDQKETNNEKQQGSKESNTQPSTSADTTTEKE